MYGSATCSTTITPELKPNILISIFGFKFQIASFIFNFFRFYLILGRFCEMTIKQISFHKATASKKKMNRTGHRKGTELTK